MPAHPQNNLAQARSLLQSGNFSRALAIYQGLVRHSPVSAMVWYEYGNAAAQLHRLPLADQAWSKALEAAPGNAELIAVIGHQYLAMRQPQKARACFAQAAAADPRAINPRISLAVLLEKANCVEEARAAVNDCFAIDPRDEQARYFAALLDRREGKWEEAERQLRDLIAADPRHPYVRYAARYELAQILDRTGRADDAMRLLAEAKDMVRGLTDTQVLTRAYDQAAQSARRFSTGLPKDILQTWAGFFPERKREPIPPLVFLGGHPRSGTTLLEQVLDAHPGVAALDEPPAFLNVLQPEFHKSGNFSSARLNVLRQLYIQALRQELADGGAGKILVDKNPSPTARLAVWLRVFPELRVIIALRDPCDVVLSCYFQNIPLNSTNVNFLSLERTATHYCDLMGIWLAVRDWPGFAWRESRYEDIVANLPNEGRRITEFLGLDWDPGQERFYENSQARRLYSPTYQEVTRPIYQRSVARWRSYEKHLAPVLPVLEPFRRAFGYA